MTDTLIFSEMQTLPEAMKIEVLHFIQFLKQKTNNALPQTTKRNRKAGSMKGKIWISPDFDAPLENFKEYI